MIPAFIRDSVSGSVPWTQEFPPVKVPGGIAKSESEYGVIMVRIRPGAKWSGSRSGRPASDPRGAGNREGFAALAG